jgi:hypothetical protein
VFTGLFLSHVGRLFHNLAPIRIGSDWILAYVVWEYPPNLNFLGLWQTSVFYNLHWPKITANNWSIALNSWMFYSAKYIMHTYMKKTKERNPLWLRNKTPSPCSSFIAILYYSSNIQDVPRHPHLMMGWLLSPNTDRILSSSLASPDLNKSIDRKFCINNEVMTTDNAWWQ